MGVNKNYPKLAQQNPQNSARKIHTNQK